MIKNRLEMTSQYFLGENVVLYVIYSVQSRVTDTYVHWLYVFRVDRKSKMGATTRHIFSIKSYRKTNKLIFLGNYIEPSLYIDNHCILPYNILLFCGNGKYKMYGTTEQA